MAKRRPKTTPAAPAAPATTQATPAPDGYAYVFVRRENRRAIVQWRMADRTAAEQQKTLNHDAGEWDEKELRERAATFLDIPADQAPLIELGQH